ncbi:hypothetical protein HD806DRAFT_206750 [Xylariaceae sp. AK1471]|nr:hypothetical protein HD806DRAFT_206750 [Xylariaceae sp. AK1471]
MAQVAVPLKFGSAGLSLAEPTLASHGYYFHPTLSRKRYVPWQLLPQATTAKDLYRNASGAPKSHDVILTAGSIKHQGAPRKWSPHAFLLWSGDCATSRHDRTISLHACKVHGRPVSSARTAGQSVRLSRLDSSIDR